jgi:hypothetical protein
MYDINISKVKCGIVDDEGPSEGIRVRQNEGRRAKGCLDKGGRNRGIVPREYFGSATAIRNEG